MGGHDRRFGVLPRERAHGVQRVEKRQRDEFDLGPGVPPEQVGAPIALHPVDPRQDPGAQELGVGVRVFPRRPPVPDSSDHARASSSVVFVRREPPCVSSGFRRDRHRIVRPVTGHAPVEVDEGSRAGAVAGLHTLDRKTALEEQRVDRSVQVTAAAHPAPERREAVLPDPHVGVRRQAVLDEEQWALRLQDAPHLAQGAMGIGNRAQRPRRDEGVGHPVGQRDLFRARLEPLDGHGRSPGATARHPEECRRRIEGVSRSTRGP